MTSVEAIDIHARFVELAAEVQKRMPKTVMRSDWRGRDDEKQDEYEFYELHLEELRATYRMYIGCGDYEYTSESINLTELFKA